METTKLESNLTESKIKNLMKGWLDDMSWEDRYSEKNEELIQSAEYFISEVKKKEEKG